MNTALKLYSSVVVVPVFYGTYTALGLVNTIIYLDEIGNYPGWAITLVFVGIGVLIYGVYLLSSKPDPSSRHLEGDEEQEQEETDINDENNSQEQQRRRTEESNSQAEEITRVMYHNKSWPSAHDEKRQHDRLQNYFASSSPSLTIPQPPLPPSLSTCSADLSLQTPIHHPPTSSSSPPPIISNNQRLDDPAASELPPPLSRSEIQQSQHGWWKRFNNIFQRKHRQFPSEEAETGGMGGSTEMAMQSMRRRCTNENSNTPSSPLPPRTSDSNLDTVTVPPTMIKVKP